MITIQQKQYFLLVLFLSALMHLSAADPEAPSNLRCSDKVNPIGTDSLPFFGWWVNDPDNNEIQTAYQIIVATSQSNIDNNIGDMWDSEKILSPRQNYIYYEGNKLKAATTYYWKVRTWDKDDNPGPYSASNEFSTGLLTNLYWQKAIWIKRNTDKNDDYTYFRKNTVLKNKTIKKALVYVSACHDYELYVNGNFAGKGFNHHYPQYSYYQTWDITSLLAAGTQNVIACLTHWYRGGQGRAKGERGLILKAIIEYTDSTRDIIVTDSSWKQNRANQWVVSQPRRNGEGVGYIETIDSRKAIKKWNTINFDDSRWLFASEIGEHPTAPWINSLQSDLTRIKEEEIVPETITQLANGNYVVDLGKIYAGNLKINFNGGTAGDTVKILGGFALNRDGSVSKRLNQKTNLEYNYILNGKESTFKTHVYLGFRYIEIENSPNSITKENCRFIARHYELEPQNAKFESTDTMLNKVWNLMTHSLLVGAQEGFVDTPTREKGTFLGDSWAQAVPCMSVFGDRTMNLKSLEEFLDSQEQYWPDGRLNAVYPNGDGKRDIPDYTQMYLFWVWDYYLQAGNDQFLKNNYDRLKQIVNYIDNYKNPSTGLIHNLAGGKGPYQYGIIDWPADMRFGYDMETEARTVINAYAYGNFDILSKIAAITGHSADVRTYSKKADELKNAINNLLISKEGIYIDGLYSDGIKSKHASQQANIIPYALGLTPAENCNAIIQHIKNLQMSVGMICLRWLPEAMGKAGEAEHLLELYTNTNWRGWANNLEKGATVTWESWNADETNQSLSHPWGAVGLLAIQNYVLGIKPLSPQCDTIQIKPLFFGDKLSWVNGTYNSDKGQIKVEWSYSDGTYKLIANIPTNCTAKVFIPKAKKADLIIKHNGKKIVGTETEEYILLNNIGSGTHVFER